MGVDIELKGSFPRAGLLSGFFPAAGLRKYVKQTTAWLDERFAGLPIEYEVAKDEDGKPLILLGLHPAAEEVRLQFDGDHHVLATARTNTAGPGYHAFVCKMLHEFAEAQKLTWLSPEGDTPGDETGYFESGDRAKLDEHMLGWLSTLATHLRDLLEKEDLEDLRICMTAGSRCNYLHGRPITTHMGPRDRDWVKRVQRIRAMGSIFSPGGPRRRSAPKRVWAGPWRKCGPRCVGGLPKRRRRAT